MVQNGPCFWNAVCFCKSRMRWTICETIRIRNHNGPKTEPYLPPRRLLGLSGFGFGLGLGLGAGAGFSAFGTGVSAFSGGSFGSSSAFAGPGALEILRRNLRTLDSHLWPIREVASRSARFNFLMLSCGVPTKSNVQRLRCGLVATKPAAWQILGRTLPSPEEHREGAEADDPGRICGIPHRTPGCNGQKTRNLAGSKAIEGRSLRQESQA